MRRTEDFLSFVVKKQWHSMNLVLVISKTTAHGEGTSITVQAGFNVGL